MLDKIKAWCRHSVTIAWAYVLLAGGFVLEVLPSAADLLASPELSDAMRAVLPSRGVGAFTIVVALVTYAARMRSIGKAAP
jgi:hypothetical protein